MRRTLVVLPLLVLACDRPIVPTPTELTQVGASASLKTEFGLALSPTELEVERGANAAVTVSIPRTQHFKKDVTLTLGALPEGVTGALDVEKTDGEAATLSLAVSSTAPLGTSTVSITGKANGRDAVSAAFQLTIVKPLTPITLDFCASDAPLFFAYQNDGEDWTPVTPDANASVFFKATDRVAIALTRGRRGNTGIVLQNAYITSVLYVTADELRPLSGITCRNEFGNKAIAGTFAGLTGAETGSVSLHVIPFTVNSFSPTFRATRKPDQGALDLIASRRVGGEPVSFIVRRGLDVPNEGTVSPIDFGSAEAVAAEFQPYSVTGLRGVNDLFFDDFWTGATPGGLPSYQQLAFRFGSGVTPLGTYRAVPAALLMPGDRHELTIRTGFNADYSGVTSVFRNGSPQSLAIGPSLNVPTFAPVAGSASPRFRATVASQAECGATVRLIATASNVFTVEATAAYHGSTPATWELTIPDLTAVPGWSPDWNFLVGQGVVLELTALSAAAVDIPALWINSAIAPWARPFAEGTVVRFAARRQSLTAVQ